MGARVHAYDNDANPIETACGRLAYNLSEGQLVEPPLLLISGDWNMITCHQCVKVWNIPPSYQLWNAIARVQARHLPHAPYILQEGTCDA